MVSEKDENTMRIGRWNFGSLLLVLKIRILASNCRNAKNASSDMISMPSLGKRKLIFVIWESQHIRLEISLESSISFGNDFWLRVLHTFSPQSIDRARFLPWRVRGWVRRFTIRDCKFGLPDTRKPGYLGLENPARVFQIPDRVTRTCNP